MEKPRRLVWIGTSRQNLKQFPDDVQDEMGYGLFLAQLGEKHHRAKPLRGFGGAGTLEMISDYRSDTYRAVYTVMCFTPFRRNPSEESRRHAQN